MTGKMPVFNVEDEALVERMLTIPHRSRFYLENVPDIPWSFLANSSIREKFCSWAPHLLVWLMPGLHEYYAHRFRLVPDSCKSFKKGLVEEQDVVGAFLDDVVEAGAPKEYVSCKELYKEFCSLNKALQADKKSKKSEATFKQALRNHLSEGTFKPSHKVRINPRKVITAYSVVLGYKRKASEEADL